jgi:hypothetical protein
MEDLQMTAALCEVCAIIEFSPRDSKLSRFPDRPHWSVIWPTATIEGPKANKDSQSCESEVDAEDGSVDVQYLHHKDMDSLWISSLMDVIFALSYTSAFRSVFIQPSR